MQDGPPTAEASARKRLLAHGSVYTLARIASQAAAFVLLPLYTHALGPEGLGIVEVTNAARGLLMVVLVQGLHSAWFRLRYDIDDAHELRRFETSIVWYLVLSNAALIALVTAIGSGTWNAAVPGVPYFPFGLLTFVAAACTVLGTLVERKLQAEQRPWSFAAFTLTRTVGTLGCIVFAVAVLKRGPRGKVEAEALAGVIGAISALFVLQPQSPRRASTQDVRRALGYGWPLIPHGIAGLANDMIDRFMVNAMLGLGAAGIYSLGYRVASVSMIVMTAVNQALAPLFVEGMRAADRESDLTRAHERRHEVAKLGLVVIALGALAVQVVTAFGPELLAWVGTRGFEQSWRVLAPVSAGVLAWVCYATLSQSLTYDGKGVRKLPWISAGAALVNVCANYVLIPLWNVEGAAWATFLSNSIMAVLAAWLGSRSVVVPYAWSRIWALLAMSAVGLAVLTSIETAALTVLARVAIKALWLVSATLAAAWLAELRPFELLRARAWRAKT